MCSEGMLFYEYPFSLMRMLFGLDFYFSDNENEALWELSIPQTL